MTTDNYLACPICSGQLLSVSRFPDIKTCKDCHAGVNANLDLIDTADYNDRPDLADRYMDSESKGSGYAIELLTYFIKLTGKREGRLLDVGCSIGTLVVQANLLGFTASGVDLDRNAVEIGVRLNRRVSYDNVMTMADSSFDMIVLQHTLEHIEEPLPFLEMLRSKLKPQGYLLISIPNYRCTLVSVLAGRWYGWQLKQHYLHYSPLALTTLFEKTKFNVIDIAMNSMDHSITIDYFLSLPAKQRILSIVTTTMVTIAKLFKSGDQIYGVAQK